MARPCLDSVVLPMAPFPILCRLPGLEESERPGQAAVDWNWGEHRLQACGLAEERGEVVMVNSLSERIPLRSGRPKPNLVTGLRPLIPPSSHRSLSRSLGVQIALVSSFVRIPWKSTKDADRKFFLLEKGNRSSSQNNGWPSQKQPGHDYFFLL